MLQKTFWRHCGGEANFGFNTERLLDRKYGEVEKFLRRSSLWTRKRLERTSDWKLSSIYKFEGNGKLSTTMHFSSPNTFPVSPEEWLEEISTRGFWSSCSTILTTRIAMRRLITSFQGTGWTCSLCLNSILDSRAYPPSGTSFKYNLTLASNFSPNSLSTCLTSWTSTWTVSWQESRSHIFLT